MAGRPRKSLDEVVRDRSFRVARHRHLLDGAVVADPGLAAIQRRYQREAGDERLRVRIAQEFAAAVEELPEASALEAIRAMPLGEFTRTYLTDFKGHRHGRPFELEPYQCAFEADVERRGDDGLRLFTIAKLIVPRGNGKTGFAAAKSLHEALRRPLKTEGFFLAESKEQAARAFDFVSTWVRMSPELTELVELQKESLTVRATGSTLRVVSARGAAFFGTSPGFVVADEAWVWRRDEQKDLWIAAASGVNKAPDGLCLLISTPPASGDSLLGDLLAHELKKEQLTERPHEALTVVRDEQNGILTHWHGLQDGVDVDDERLWQLANPASFKTLKVLRQQREVLASQAGMFELLHLGMLGADSEDQLISREQWDACRVDELNVPSDRPVYLGCEQAFGGGCVAVAVVWRQDDGRVAAKVTVFASRDEPTPAHERRDGWRLRVDTEAVMGVLDEMCAAYRVRGVTYDPLELRIDAARLRATVNEIRVGSSVTKTGSRRLYQLIATGILAHDGDDVLSQHVLNTRGEWDSDERLTVRRGRQDIRISGWYSLVHALLGMPERESVYERRGVLVVDGVPTRPHVVDEVLVPPFY